MPRLECGTIRSPRHMFNPHQRCPAATNTEDKHPWHPSRTSPPPCRHPWLQERHVSGQARPVRPLHAGHLHTHLLRQPADSRGRPRRVRAHRRRSLRGSALLLLGRAGLRKLRSHGERRAGLPAALQRVYVCHGVRRGGCRGRGGPQSSRRPPRLLRTRRPPSNRGISRSSAAASGVTASRAPWPTSTAISTGRTCGRSCDRARGNLSWRGRTCDRP